MRVVVVVPPEPVVTLEQAAAHLELGDDTERLEQVEAMVKAATASIDGWNRELGRSIGPQTLEVHLDGFESRCAIDLPGRPIKSIESVSYVDLAGATQAMLPLAFRLVGDAVLPAFGADWPGARQDHGAVVVRYVAGYDVLPEDLRHAILLMVGDMFRFRETASADGSVPSKLPTSVTVDRLLQPFRVYQ